MSKKKKPKKKARQFDYITPKTPTGPEGTSKVKKTHRGRTHHKT